MSSIASVTPTVCSLFGVKPPRDPRALEAFMRHLKSFETLAAAFNERYASVNRAVAFTPDHGTHIDPATGKGTHGTDSPEDVDVRHFWGVSRGS